ncbi:MAG TPA: phenylalanine--tRNA ligase subunit alpha [Patescibacteria group bacterium]|nr:phenylalanine--tRNA ligase subunit alpha [Patescibacteria group bacterium]
MLDKKIAEGLIERAKKGDTTVLRSIELKALFDQIKTLPAEDRSVYGQEFNKLKTELTEIITEHSQKKTEKKPIDITAPWDVNTPTAKRGRLEKTEDGSIHPLMRDMQELIDIFARMGFSSVESRQLDDDWNMFTSLNFPADHPARDDYDTFLTEEKDKKGNHFIAPAHTSTMQNRVLKQNKSLLEKDEPIAYIIPGRVFRNEDLDARHEHTFYQLEAVYVNKGVNAGMLIATLKKFLQEYYQKEIKVKTQPFYFPFTEPSFEFAASCVFCEQKGCNVCSYSGWIELGGCGMIHPNVLKAAEIDPKIYTGFAWGFGIDRLVMLKYGIEDVRHFHSGKLNFLRQFK